MHFFKLIFLIFVFINIGSSIKWLSISLMKSKFIEPTDCPSSKEEKKGFGFVQYQSEFCRRMIDLMPYIKNAADLTIKSCLNVFEKHRWNCSSIYKTPNFNTDLTKGTKEQAYIYALSAATIVHQIAKACSAGILEYCSCGLGGTLIVNSGNNNELPDSEDYYKWQGCSDNVEYGILVSKEWSDALWKPKIRLTRDISNGFLDIIHIEKQRERIKQQQFNNNQKQQQHLHHQNDDNYIVENNKKNSINQHNNHVGRMTVSESGNIKCKCHGVSSSCHIKTCWNSLPSINIIAQKLKSKYLIAQQLSSKSHFLDPKMMIKSTDLVYIKPSSNYCELTHGRECNSTDSTVLDSCQNLCCDRGYQSTTILESNQCHCRYFHCCYVQCKKCTYHINKSYCN